MLSLLLKLLIWMSHDTGMGNEGFGFLFDSSRSIGTEVSIGSELHNGMLPSVMVELIMGILLDFRSSDSNPILWLFGWSLMVLLQ